MPPGAFEAFGPQYDIPQLWELQRALPQATAQLPPGHAANPAQAEQSMPPVDVAAKPTAAYQDPYAGPLSQVRGQIDALDKQPLGAMHNPQELARRRAMNDINDQFGMLAALSGDEQMQGVGGQLLKQAMAGRERKMTDSGEYDPETGSFTHFPHYTRELNRKKLMDREAKLEAEQLKAQANFQEQRMRADEREGLKQIVSAGQQQRLDELQQQRIFQRSQALQADYEKINKTLESEVHAADNLMRLSAKGGEAMNAQEQQALIFSFMRMLDPTSVVRESEYASAARARGIFDTAAVYLQQLQSGKPLSAQQVINMYNIARDYKDAAFKVKVGTDQLYTQRAQRWGVDPADVIRSMGAAEGPQVRQVSPGVSVTVEQPPVNDRRKEPRYAPGVRTERIE